MSAWLALWVVYLEKEKQVAEYQNREIKQIAD